MVELRGESRLVSLDTLPPIVGYRLCYVATTIKYVQFYYMHSYARIPKLNDSFPASK